VNSMWARITGGMGAYSRLADLPDEAADTSSSGSIGRSSRACPPRDPIPWGALRGPDAHG
jgi:hypothetical protein